jgi:hypothetical protein
LAFLLFSSGDSRGILRIFSTDTGETSDSDTSTALKPPPGCDGSYRFRYEDVHDLNELDARYAGVADISSLVANCGIGEGDYVRIDDNPPLDCSRQDVLDDVAAPETRDVDLNHSCN